VAYFGEREQLPWVQQARGAKEPDQKYFMTNKHKSEYDAE